MSYRFFNLVFLSSIFDFKTLGVYDGGITYTEDTLLKALILTYHPNLVKRYDIVRRLIEKYPYSYSRPARMEEYYLQARTFNEIASLEVNDEVDLIIKELKFPPVWRDPLMVKVFTNLLPIPYDPAKITFTPGNLKAIYKERELESVKKLSDPGFGSVLRKAQEEGFRLDNAKFPYIAIKERLHSRTELIDFIEAIYEKEIQPAMDNLPKRIHHNFDLDRFMLGLWLFNYRQNNHKPKKITSFIEGAEKVMDISFSGYDVSNTGISKLIDESRKKLSQFYPL